MVVREQPDQSTDSRTSTIAHAYDVRTHTEAKQKVRQNRHFSERWIII
jgi:hypothetical protein